MVGKILCVAEKPSIAKAVAEHLSGGRFNTRNGGSVYNKNYDFDFSFNPPWGDCAVTVTSVSGHMTGIEFPPQYKNWAGTPIIELFDARIVDVITEVGVLIYDVKDTERGLVANLANLRIDTD